MSTICGLARSLREAAGTGDAFRNASQKQIRKTLGMNRKTRLFWADLLITWSNTARSRSNFPFYGYSFRFCRNLTGKQNIFCPEELVQMPVLARANPLGGARKNTGFRCQWLYVRFVSAGKVLSDIRQSAERMLNCENISIQQNILVTIESGLPARYAVVKARVEARVAWNAGGGATGWSRVIGR